MSKNPTDNDNWQLHNKPSFAEVEDLANSLCEEYDNREYFKWYCLVINILGATRVREISGMYQDINERETAAKLFSARASQEAKKKVGIARYQSLKSQYVKK